MTREEKIASDRRVIENMTTDLAYAREVLADDMRTAQSEGATIAQLMEWSGLSRRAVFNVLKR